MYQNRTPNINTNIGSGEAQVFAADKPNFSGVGFGVGYNSKGAVQKRTGAKGIGIVDELDDDYKDLIPSAAKKFQERNKEIYQFASDPKNINSPEYMQRINELATDYKSDLEMAKKASEQVYNIKKDVRENPYDYSQEDVERLERATTDLEFGTVDGEQPFDRILAEAHLVTNITKQNKDEFKMPDYSKMLVKESFDDMRGVRNTKSTKRLFAPEAEEKILQDAEKVFNAGKNTAEGKAAIRDGAAEKKYKETMQKFATEKKRDIADLGQDFEAIRNLEKEYFKEQYLAEAKSMYEGEDKGTILKDPKEVKTEDGDDKFDNNLYQITTEKQVNKSKIVSTGDEKTLGEENYVVSNTPEVNMVVEMKDGEKAEGRSFKIRYDANGDKKVYVKVKAKSDNSNARIIEKIVDYDQIKGQLNKKELEFFDRHFKLMEKEQGSLKGFTQEEADKLTKGVEGIRDGVFTNRTDEVKELVNEFFGSEVVSAYDPKGDSNDITLKIKEGKKTVTKHYNLDNPDEAAKFVEFAKDYREKQQNTTSSTGGAY